jgi:hypothetical protein
VCPAAGIHLLLHFSHSSLHSLTSSLVMAAAATTAGSQFNFGRGVRGSSCAASTNAHPPNLSLQSQVTPAVRESRVRILLSLTSSSPPFSQLQHNRAKAIRMMMRCRDSIFIACLSHES